MGVSRQSTQSPKAYDLQNLQPQQLGKRIFPALTAETGGDAASDFRFPTYPLYSVRRQGAALDGATDDYAALNKVVSVASALGLAVVVDGPMVVGTNITVPANVEMWFAGAGLIKPAAGVTVTLNGPVHSAPAKRFDLSNAGALIRGSFGGVPYVPQWWGVVGDGDFGATIGGTINTTAFQQCLDAAAARSGTTHTVSAVHVPVGIYRLDATVSIGDGIALKGAGRWGTIFFCQNAFASANGLFHIVAGGTAPTTIQSLAVIAQTNGATTGGNGIVSDKNGVSLSDLWVSAFLGGSGIVINQTEQFISDVVVELCQQGFELKQVHINLQHCSTYQCSVAGILIDNGSAAEFARVHITGYRSTEDSQQGIVISSGKFVTLTACSFEDHSNTKYTDAAIRIDVANDILVTGCVGKLGAQSVTTTTAQAGISITGASTNVRITGCAFSNFRDGVVLGTNGQTLRATLTGNDCSGNARYGINCFGGDEVLITGNTCDSNGVTGIKLDNSATAGKWGVCSNRCASNATYGYDINLGLAEYINFVGNTYNSNGTNLHVTGTSGNLNNVGSF